MAAAGVTAAALEDMVSLVIFTAAMEAKRVFVMRRQRRQCVLCVLEKRGDWAANPKHRKKKDPDYCRDYL